MSSVNPQNQSYTDGKSTVPAYIVLCLNLLLSLLPKKYMYVSDDIGIGANFSASTGASNEHLGGVVTSGAKEGSITIQLATHDEVQPLPGYILAVRGEYFVVSGKVAPKREINKQVQLTLPVVRCANPVLTGLLSTDGQLLQVAATHAVAITAIDPKAVNTRPGATISYSATGLPDGLTISSTTGQITGTPTTAGAVNAEINCVDTLVLPNGEDSVRTGVGYIRFTIA